MAIIEDVRALLTPVLEAESAFLYDIEHNGSVLRIFVDASGGIPVGELQRLSRLLSRRLDELDPIAGRYTLEVSSPGLERRLRTPDHFRGALGEQITIKTKPTDQGATRLQGVLISADDEGVIIETDGQQCQLRYQDISKARTLFEWGNSSPQAKQRLDQLSTTSARLSATTNKEAPTS